MLPKYIKVNKFTIKFQNRKWLLYKSIYNIKLLNFTNVKIYIKINLSNSFISMSNLLAFTMIIFFQNSKDSFYLYINYLGSDNLTIKNQYLLSWFEKCLNKLSHAKYFIQFNYISTNYKIKMNKNDK